MLPDIFYEVITEPSTRELIREPKLIQAVTSEDWRGPLMAFINGFYQPITKAEKSRMQ